MSNQKKKIHAYILKVDRENGWKAIPSEKIAQNIDYLRTNFTNFSLSNTILVPKGTLVEFDPLCTPIEKGTRSINVISLDEKDVKVSVLMKELVPIESHHYEILLPLTPIQRHDLISNEKWRSILEVNVGDTVWYYRSSKAASVAAKSRLNGNYGNVSNASGEKDVGFVRYVGNLESANNRLKGFWIGVELFLEANRGDCNGTWKTTKYFDANENSSVFTTVNHLYIYDEEEDIEQIRQKIGIYKASVDENLARNQPQNHATKKTVWRKFEMDRQNNQENQQRVLGQNRGSYVEKLMSNEEKTGDTNYSAFLKVGDRIVWLSDYGPQYGTVKWIGHLPEADTTDLVAGIEFENPIGSGAGYYNNQAYFKSREGHGSFVPLCGLLKAEDFDNGGSTGGSSASFQRREHQKLVDEIELKRRSNSQQERLADYKMRQNLNRLKNSGASGSSSRNGTDENFSPSILGSLELENEINWTPSTQSSPPRQNRFTDQQRQNDLSLISSPKAEHRDPYASEDFLVTAQVHGDRPVKLEVENKFEQDQTSSILLPEFLKLQSDADQSEPNFEEGTLVELHIRDQNDPIYGVVKWIGYPTNDRSKMAGIELEEEISGGTNGWHEGTQLFACPDRKAVFVPLTHLMPDKRFENSRDSGPDVFENGNGTDGANHNNHLTNGFGEFGEIDCPVVPGFQSPIKGDDLAPFCGRNRGIQGHQNSCYLDATLFVMFSFTSVFDCLLYRPPSTQDIDEYTEVQRVLREEIVNPLRKNWFVRADRVMKLRQLLDSLTSVRGLMSEEKDPEELLNSLLSQTLKASPFLELSSGQNAHLYQLFVERDESKSLPSVQELFEQSFLTSGVKLKRVPSVLILQMPRFGRQFKVYDRILPSQILDVTDVIEDAPRQCIVCGKLAGWECAECFGDHGEGLDSTAFCETCLTRVHNHQKRRKHKMNQLKVPQEYFAQGYGNNDGHNPRLYMELFAVMCIETSHYVSFVKCGLGPDAPWCFFDSMADRKGEKHGYNIPEVTAAPHVANWLSEDGVKLLNNCRDDKMLPDFAKRLICDGYMCFYQSPQVMMYQ